ncbi:hypothetical protein GCM10010166_62360 [Couchioplanes caeruleus subsp. azureus]|nr:hypothetical protein GCM10010166_62360 [Couchioplanes caeruleus subsp. azureus]
MPSRAAALPIQTALPLSVHLDRPYGIDATVWIERGGGRRPGLVVRASRQAVTVRYRPGDGPATVVDTVPAARVDHRGEPDLVDDPERRMGCVRRAS